MRKILRWAENALQNGVHYTWAFLARLTAATLLMAVLAGFRFEPLSFEVLVTIALGFTILERQQAHIDAARTLEQERRP